MNKNVQCQSVDRSKNDDSRRIYRKSWFEALLKTVCVVAPFIRIIDEATHKQAARSADREQTSRVSLLHLSYPQSTFNIVEALIS